MTKPAKGKKPKDEEHDGERLVNEIIWTLKRAGILLKNWTMPITNSATTPTHDDGASARALALAAIVGLTFAVRGEPLGSHRAAFTAMIGVLAAIASFGLNAAIKRFNLQNRFDAKARERWLISAYVSLIGVMVFFVLFQTTLTGLDFYEMLSEVMGATLFPIFLAGIATFVLLLIKAIFLDKNRIDAVAVIHGAIVLFACGAITFGISALSNNGFNGILDWIAKV